MLRTWAPEVNFPSVCWLGKPLAPVLTGVIWWTCQWEDNSWQTFADAGLQVFPAMSGLVTALCSALPLFLLLCP